MAMFNKEGWLVLLWGILLLPIGFTVQAIALFKADILPVWQSTSFLIGVLRVGVPDGIESNLTASVLMAIAFVPYGVQMILNAADIYVVAHYGLKPCFTCADAPPPDRPDTRGDNQFSTFGEKELINESIHRLLASGTPEF